MCGQRTDNRAAKLGKNYEVRENEITMFPEPYEGIFSLDASREEPSSLDRLRHMQLNYNRTNNGHPADLLAPPGD